MERATKHLENLKQLKDLGISPFSPSITDLYRQKAILRETRVFRYAFNICALVALCIFTFSFTACMTGKGISYLALCLLTAIGLWSVDQYLLKQSPMNFHYLEGYRQVWDLSSADTVVLPPQARKHLDLIETLWPHARSYVWSLPHLPSAGCFLEIVVDDGRFFIANWANQPLAVREEAIYAERRFSLGAA